MSIPYRSEEVAHAGFFKYQMQMERAISQLHKDTEASLNKIINRNTELSGVVAKHKVKIIVDDYMTAELKIYRAELQRQISIGVMDSSHLGVNSIIGATEPRRKVTSQVWQDISRKAKNRVLTNRASYDGLKLSERVWNLSNTNTYQLKKIIASDILQGNSAAKISRDIRGFLRQPATLRGRARDLARPGQGVYRSAYKNAMRVARDATNDAYIEGAQETAGTMGYKLQFTLSPVHSVTDICDDYAGRIYTPETYPGRLHSHCKCYPTTVLGTA